MKRALLALVLILAALAVIAIRAPAAWLADALAERTKLRLVDARGTLWQGSALIGVSNGRETTLLPGRLEWAVTGWRSGHIWARATHPWLAKPVDLGLGAAGLRFVQGSARLPAAALAATG